MSSQAIYLDGRTLEGGGQLVRVALALSTITGQSITIDHIRGNRSGKQGLKGSHLAAIEFLADVSKSTVSGGTVGSTSLTFRPPRTLRAHQETDINIRLPTAGSIFLVFQALYPYLLHAGVASDQPPEPIRMTITGGTNVSFAPSYDYIAQVLVPNFARVGLPRLTVQLEKRAWATGAFGLGKATFVMEPIRGGGGSRYGFPRVDLGEHRRGRVTRIDITVLAPDSLLRTASRRGRSAQKNDASPHLEHTDQTTRQFVQDQTTRILRTRLSELPSSIFETSNQIPINIHTSETTHHHSHLYILIVAHTSNGFKLGRDALYGARARGPRRNGRNGPEDMQRKTTELVEKCVDDFIQELYDPRLQSTAQGHQPCVDEYMRDQMVIFEALGGSTIGNEDERYHSLHTQTVRWVCEQICI